MPFGPGTNSYFGDSNVSGSFCSLGTGWQLWVQSWQIHKKSCRTQTKNFANAKGFEKSQTTIHPDPTGNHETLVGWGCVQLRAACSSLIGIKKSVEFMFRIVPLFVFVYWECFSFFTDSFETYEYYIILWHYRWN